MTLHMKGRCTSLCWPTQPELAGNPSKGHSAERDVLSLHTSHGLQPCTWNYRPKGSHRGRPLSTTGVGERRLGIFSSSPGRAHGSTPPNGILHAEKQKLRQSGGKEKVGAICSAWWCHVARKPEKMGSDLELSLPFPLSAQTQCRGHIK